MKRGIPLTSVRAIAWRGRALGVLALLLAARGRIAAQEMEIPVAIQVSLFLKVITFDRQRTFDEPLILGVVFQGGNRASVTAKKEVLVALERAVWAAAEIRAIPIDLDKESLAAALARHRPGVVYVAPLRAVDIADIAALTRTAGVTTVTGVPHFVTLGLAVGVRRQGDRPKLLVNLPAARAEGADFSSELLKLAQVSPW